MQSKGKILVVDDDPAIRMTVEAVLEDGGFATAVATNGNRYTFDLGTLAAGSATSIVLTAAYTGGQVGITLTNWAAVYTPTQELSKANNEDTAITAVIGFPERSP